MLECTVHLCTVRATAMKTNRYNTVSVLSKMAMDADPDTSATGFQHSSADKSDEHYSAAAVKALGHAVYAQKTAEEYVWCFKAMVCDW